MQRHGRYPCRLPGCKPAFLLQATGFLGCPYHRIRPRSCQLSSAHNKSAHCPKPTISIFLLSSDSMSFLTLLSRAGRVGNVAEVAELACSSPFDSVATGRRQLPLSSPEVATSLTAEIGDFSTVCRKQTHVLQLTIFFLSDSPVPFLHLSAGSNAWLSCILTYIHTLPTALNRFWSKLTFQAVARKGHFCSHLCYSLP